MCAVKTRVVLFGCLAVALTTGGIARAAVLGEAVTATIADEVNVTSFTIGVPAGFTRPVPNGNWVSFTDNDTFGDEFGYMARIGGNELEDVVNPEPSFDFLDDTPTFSGDVFGVIPSDDFDNFFGIHDTVNGDTGNTHGPESTFTGTWVFDITGATGSIGISVDVAAMGDFEPFTDANNPDKFDFEYSFNGVDYFPAFTSGILNTEFIEEDLDDGGFTDPIDQTVEGQDVSELPPEVVYTMDNGVQVAWNDPLTMNGEPISNEFETISVNIGEATSSSLSFRFTGLTGSGSEVFMFRNIVIEDGLAGPILAGDYNEDGTVDAADYTVYRDALEAGAPSLPNDATPGVDATDYDQWANNFGSTAGVANAIPEPTAALLAAIALAGLATRRNG